MKAVPSFKVVEGWEKLPAGYMHKDVCGVSCDSRDNVYLMTRQDPQILVYDRDGNFLRAWGRDIFSQRGHGVSIDRHDNVYAVDDGDHTVRKFAPDGREVMKLGISGRGSDTGYDGSGFASIKHGAGPFNRPTGIAIADDGELYVCDGYGNARVHRFTADGKLLRSWGEPGIGPGQFFLPHGIAVSPDNRVFVTDRESDRIHIYSRDGDLLDMWTHVQRPTDICFDKEGRAYVSELWWRVGQASYTNGPIKFDLPGGVRVLDLKGNLLLHWCSADREAAGNFVSPHTLCVDSQGDLYVGEVTWTFGVSKFGVNPNAHTFQKFQRC